MMMMATTPDGPCGDCGTGSFPHLRRRDLVHALSGGRRPHTAAAHMPA